MIKFKTGDEVLVTAGKDKSKKGKIEKVFPKEEKLTINGINVYKRHKKVSKTQGAGIFEIARPLPFANIALICPKCNKPTRVGFLKEGKVKKRICKKCKGALS